MLRIKVLIMEDELWEEAGELKLAVSREEMEDARDGVCGSESSQMMCKTALSEGNSAMSTKLQSALPKSGS